MEREELRAWQMGGIENYAYRETKVSQSIRMQQRLHAVSLTQKFFVHSKTILYSVSVVIGSEPRYSEPPLTTAINPVSTMTRVVLHRVSP